MRKIAIVAAVLALSAGAVHAESEPVVLTPTKLYDLVEEQQQVNKEQTDTDIVLNRRLMVVEATVDDTRSSLANALLEVRALKKANAELERKMAGVQKEVTRLHAISAKKADKK